MDFISEFLFYVGSFARKKRVASINVELRSRCFFLFFFIVFRSCYIDTRDLRPAGRILCKILKDVLYPIYERDRMTHAGETLYCHPMLPLNVNVRHRLNRSSILSFSLTPSPFFPFPLPFLVL